jgi:hypothetical protein
MLRGRHREKTVTAKTFENIVFLAEIFGEKADQEIPKAQDRTGSARPRPQE